MAAKITFLYSNIGRGHPFYLDGILEALIRRGAVGLVRHQTDVFEVSHGVSRRAWQLARYLYERGSSGGVIGSIYGSLRRDTDYNRRSFGLKILGRDIRSAFMKSDLPLLVDHPTLVGILKGRTGLIYQHGELVAPGESIVVGASMVCVPTEEIAALFRGAGYRPDQVFVSGLCIEPSLVRQAESAYVDRINRLESRTPLTGAFFSSGAEPEMHVAALCESCLAVAQEGGKAIVFAKEGGHLHTTLSRVAASRQIEDLVVTSSDFLPQDLPPILIALHRNRREETALTSRLFPYFDYFVAPSHERSNWALGLGLVMFVLTPTIGEYARLNLDLLRNASVAVPLDQTSPAPTLGLALRRMRREGQLQRISQAGWHKRNIDGFSAIADFLVKRYA